VLDTKNRLADAIVHDADAIVNSIADVRKLNQQLDLIKATTIDL